MRRIIRPIVLVLLVALTWGSGAGPVEAEVPLGFTATVSELSCTSGQLQFDGSYMNRSGQAATVEFQINERSYFTLADVQPNEGGGRQFLDSWLHPLRLKPGQPYSLEATVNGEAVAAQSGVTPKCPKALMYMDVSKAYCRNGQPMIDWVAVSQHPQRLAYDLILTEGRKAITGGAINPHSKIHGSFSLLKFRKPGEGYSLTWGTGDGGADPFPATGTVPDCRHPKTTYMQLSRVPIVSASAAPAAGSLVDVTVDPGQWSPAPEDYSVQWLRVKQTVRYDNTGGGHRGPTTYTPIAGATGHSYTPSKTLFPADTDTVSYRLMARVTVTRPGYPDSVSYSRPVDPRFVQPIGQW